eukprot:scaffold116844_cov21-Phaeocystis_antarctica.AAC.1
MSRVRRLELELAGHVAMVVVDDRDDAAVVGGHGAQVGRGQPTWLGVELGLGIGLGLGLGLRLGLGLVLRLAWQPTEGGAL